MARLGVKTINRLSAIGVGLWILWASLFILRSPGNAFTHDFRGHFEHTRILFNQRRLALPREGWETYQPPFYYLIDTLLSPNDVHHVFRVRLLSMLYGGATLFLMSRFLTQCKITPPAQALILTFLATTPAFLFLFTTYNNDSLATLLSVGIFIAAFEWVSHGRRGSLFWLGLLTTMGLYTKMTVLFPLAIVVVLLSFLGLARRVSLGRILPAVGAIGIGALLLIPWLIGHNLRLTGQLLPAPADFSLADELRLSTTPLHTLLTPPGWGKGEWSDPYVNIWGKTQHKKNSFVDYVFVTSVFGEYTFGFLPSVIPWAIIIIHAFLWIAALVRARRSPLGILSIAVIFMGFLCLSSLILKSPYVTLMDFRYIAWAWLPGVVLYAVTLFPPPATPRIFSLASAAKTVMISGTVLHGLLWIALILGGRWNLP